MLSRFHRIPGRYGRTDGQTNGRTENCYINTRVNLLMRDKNGSRDPNDATVGGNFFAWAVLAIYLKNVPLTSYLTLKNIVTLKSGLGIIQGY